MSVGQLAVHDNDLRQDNLIVATRPNTGSTAWGPVTLYADRTEINLMNLKGRLRNRSVYNLDVTNSMLETWDGWKTGHTVDTRSQGSAARTTLTDCTLNALEARGNSYGHGVNFLRCDISGGEDSMELWWNMTLTDCYVHDLTRLVGSHNDIFQSGGTGNSRVGHCTLLAAQRVPDGQGLEFSDGWYDPMNAVLMIGDNAGAVTGLVIEDSLCDGGNYMFNDNWQGKYLVENIIIRNNRIGRHFRYGVRSIKNASTDPSPPTWVWEGNVWDDTGESIG
jgi:hypothetical protein